VTGVTQFIKGSAEHGLEPKKANLYTVAVEPMEQMLLTEAKGGEKIGPQGPHKFQGMGAGIIPKVLDLDLIDEVVAIHSDEASTVSLRLWRK
jgi:cysteine synthase A